MEKNIHNGFTLIEVLISMAIFILVAVAVFNVYLTGDKFYREGEVRAELLQNGRIILERMAREIRQAREIVTELSEEKSGATSTIIFEDGHSTTTYRYIHYFEEDDLVKREVVGYYFSGDSEQTLVPWDTVPPLGQTLATTTLEQTEVIGEYVSDLQIWDSEVIHTHIILQNRNKTIELKTKSFIRNM